MEAHEEAREQRWARDCGEGSRKAQKEVFEFLAPYLRGAVRRYIFDDEEVQDVLQEAFIRVFRSIHKFDAGRGTLRSWSARIAVNVAITEGKRRARQQALPGQVELQVEPKVLEDMALQDLVTELQGMPEDQYEVLNLHLVDGFSHKEISDMIGITVDLSRQRLARARKWVQTRFELSGDEMRSLNQNPA
jgi:RNA polymerase sigma factor (sigma-70 family)